MLLALRSLYEAIAVLVTAAGVAASPTVGTASVNVTSGITGVSASASVGSLRFNAAERLTGVSAAPAIGIGRFSSDFSLSGVAANTSVGAANLKVTWSLSGIAASPATGSFSENVTFTPGGVTASAAIGHGIVLTGATETIYLTGVSASAAIGTGTVHIVSSVTYPRPLAEYGVYAPRKRVKAPMLLPAVVVDAKGVCASGRNGKPHFNVDALIHFETPSLRVVERQAAFHATTHIENSVAGNVALGRGNVETLVDLTDEEILALMEAA